MPNKLLGAMLLLYGLFCTSKTSSPELFGLDQSPAPSEPPWFKSTSTHVAIPEELISNPPHAMEGP